MVLAYPSIFTHKGLTRLRKSGCLHPFLWLLALGLAAKRRRETTVIKLKLPALGSMDQREEWINQWIINGSIDQSMD